MKRTKEQTIELFKTYAFEYDKIAARTDDERERIEAAAKAEAYELAAFELEHNLD